MLVFASTAAYASDTTNVSKFQPKRDINFKALSGRSANLEEAPLVLYCWQGSPSCYQLESALNQWVQDSGIIIKYKPLIMRPHWRLLAKARLVARTMGQEPAVVSAIYQQLHQEKQALDTEEALFEIIETLGMSASRFANLFYSPEINASLNAIERETKQLDFRGVPSLVINNNWYTDASMLKTPREFLYTIEFLLGVTTTP